MQYELAVDGCSTAVPSERRRKVGLERVVGEYWQPFPEQSSPFIHAADNRLAPKKCERAVDVRLELLNAFVDRQRRMEVHHVVVASLMSYSFPNR